MSRVIHADGRDAIAIIEPGVTFPEFDRQLHPHGLRAVKPLLPRRSKSVLACYLEREPTISPNEHWDSTDPLASLSIVFGNGERFRTGGASAPGSLEQNLERGLRQMMASGPVTTDYTRVLLGAQGTLGIVCWGSIYCERIPAMEQPHLFGADTLQPLVAMVRHLSLQQLGIHYFILNRYQLAAVLADNGDDFARYCRQFDAAGLPPWCLYVNLGTPDYQPREAMAWQSAGLNKIADTAGASAIWDADFPVLQQLAQRIQISPARYYKDVPLGHHRDVFCLVQMERAASLVDMARSVLNGAQSNFDGDIISGFYLQPTVQGTGCHVEISLFHREAAADEVLALEQQLVDALSTHGGFFSRPYGGWSEVAYRRDYAIVPQLRRVKSIFDPAGILSPGRLCF